MYLFLRNFSDVSNSSLTMPKDNARKEIKLYLYQLLTVSHKATLKMIIEINNEYLFMISQKEITVLALLVTAGSKLFEGFLEAILLSKLKLFTKGAGTNHACTVLISREYCNFLLRDHE